MTLPSSSNVEPIRRGFVGYLNVGGLRWRVMVRVWLDDEALWGGRIWFSEPGGTEVWDKQVLLGRSPEELIQQARGFGAHELIRRFSHSYDERRRYFALRALMDDLIEKGRFLNRISLRAAEGTLTAQRADQELDRLQKEMRGLVDGMRAVATQGGRLTT
jgi:hypothetical protein